MTAFLYFFPSHSQPSLVYPSRPSYFVHSLLASSSSSSFLSSAPFAQSSTLTSCRTTLSIPSFPHTTALRKNQNVSNNKYNPQPRTQLNTTRNAKRILTQQIQRLANDQRLSNTYSYQHKQSLVKKALELLYSCPDPDVVIYNACITVCDRLGEYQTAIRLLRSMSQLPVQLHPNVVSYSACISACAHANQPDLAIRLFQELADSPNIAPNHVSYTACIHACATAATAAAVDVADPAAAPPPPPPSPPSQPHRLQNVDTTDNQHQNSYTPPSHFQSQRPYFYAEKASTLLHQFLQLGFRPNPIIFSACIRAWQHIPTESQTKFDFNPPITPHSSHLYPLPFHHNSIYYLYQMISYNLVPNIFVFKIALQVAASNNAWSLVIAIHQLINKFHVQPDIHAYNYLLSAYRFTHSFQQIYDLVNSMLISSSEQQKHSQTILHYTDKNILPNIQTFNICIQTCFYSKDYDRLFHYYQLLNSQHLQPNHLTLFFCIKASLATNSYDSALDYFSKLVASSNTTDHIQIIMNMATTVLKNCIRNHRTNHAARVMQLLHANNMLPSIHQYKLYIMTFIKARDHSTAIQILRTIQASYPRDSSLHATLYATCIALCEKSHQWHNAIALMHEMIANKLPTNATAFNSAISACIQQENGSMALSFYEKMLSLNVEPDLITYNLVLVACEQDQNQLKAAQIARLLQTARPNRSLASCNSFILSYARQNKWRPALSLLRKMKSTGIAPNIVSYCACIRALEKSAKFDQAIALFRELQYSDNGIKPDLISYTLCISAAKNARRPHLVLKLYDEMRSDNTGRIRPDPIVYSLCMSACAQSGLWKNALQLFQHMISDGLEPNPYCYSACIAACGKAGKWTRALRLLEKMRMEGQPIDEACYSSCITACARAQQYDTSLKLLWRMKADRIQPHLNTYNTVMRLCGEFGKWKDALQLWQEIQYDGLTPNIVSYQSCIRACQVGGQWNRALRILDEMKAMNMSPGNQSMLDIIMDEKRYMPMPMSMVSFGGPGGSGQTSADGHYLTGWLSSDAVTNSADNNNVVALALTSQYIPRTNYLAPKPQQYLNLLALSGPLKPEAGVNSTTNSVSEDREL